MEENEPRPAFNERAWELAKDRRDRVADMIAYTLWSSVNAEPEVAALLESVYGPQISERLTEWKTRDDEMKRAMGQES